MHVLQYANVSIHVYKRFLSLCHENRGTPSALAPPGVPGRVWRRGGGRPGRGATSRPAAPAPPGLPPRAVPRGTRGCHEGTTVLVLVGTRQRVTPRLRWLPSSLRSGSVSGCASPRLRLRALLPHFLRLEFRRRPPHARRAMTQTHDSIPSPCVCVMRSLLRACEHDNDAPTRARLDSSPAKFYPPLAESSSRIASRCESRACLHAK